MRRADLREKAAARLDVVVIARDAGFMQAAKLRARQQAVRGAEADMQRVAHGFVRLDGFVEVASRERASRRHDGEAVGTGCFIGAGMLYDGFFRQERVFLDARMMAGCLRAVSAVFTAAAAAAVDDGAEVDVTAAEMLLQQMGTFLELL